MSEDVQIQTLKCEPEPQHQMVPWPLRKRTHYDGLAEVAWSLGVDHTFSQIGAPEGQEGADMSEFEGHTPEPWQTDAEMRDTLAGEHWCIWQLDAEGNLAHTEPLATVWNYLHPGGVNRHLIAAAPRLLRQRDEARDQRDKLADALGHLFALVNRLRQEPKDPQHFAAPGDHDEDIVETARDALVELED